MSQRTELIEKIEALENETGMSLAMTDPKKYKDNNKKIEQLRAKFRKAN